jgi:hypothetical protein
VNRRHTTEPVESGTIHYWQVGDGRRAVSLSALYLRGAASQAPILAGYVSPVEGGGWMFDVMQDHWMGGPDSGWSCDRHGDDCDMDAFVTSYARPVWARIVSAGVGDQSVFAELERVHADNFGEEAA